MDRTVINLTSLLLGGAGIFAVLTEYSVRELRKTYWGENPFAIKAEVIKGLTTSLFVALAVVATLLQAMAEIVGDRLPERRHGLPAYVLFFLVGVALDVGIVRGLAWLGRKLARRRWWPEVIKSQSAAFVAARAIVLNDGWRDDQLELKDKLDDQQKYREANWEAAERSIAQIERLLELPPRGEHAKARLARLAVYFASA